MLDEFVTKTESEFAKTYLEKLKARDFAYVREHLAEELQEQVTDEKLSEIANYFPEEEIISTKLVGVHILQKQNFLWQGNYSFEYQFKTQWVLANAVVRYIEKDMKILGFNIYPARTISLKELNAFSLHNKSLFHYVILILAVSIPIFILISVYVCIRTPILQWKWAWIIFICLGFFSISINWTTGQFAFKLFSVYVLGASAIKYGFYAPWIVSVSVPIGAIVFWIKRRHFLQHIDSIEKQEEKSE